MDALIRTTCDAPPGTMPFSRRSDFVTAEVVEKGIALQEVLGTKAAADFLRRKMIDMEVASRVLLRPAERRG
ncbi:hypothetical protein [Noviherbaspirillum sp.]|jgi:hypothetical protein|uniref:hypothetical protein n=1 Tax=Noviherbaspirillum sp. TaxID=1926288 RepID=UPI0025FFDFF9|nr:hypothetical protein [Noviherbaspirillum sp.]